jgi:hypothetical protein
MKALNTQAEQIFGYLPVEFIQAKKTMKGFSFYHTAGKPDEISSFNQKMKSAGAINKNGYWLIIANEWQTMAEAVKVSSKAFQKQQDIENAERYGFSSVEAYKSAIAEA